MGIALYTVLKLRSSLITYHDEREYMTRETVGSLSRSLMLKEPDTRDPIELEREMHKDYEKNILLCIEDGKKYYKNFFYIIVITKKERLMPNVLRNYFFHRSSCPTPDYDQALYRYTIHDDKIEFLWVIPSKDTCLTFTHNVTQIVPEELGLLRFILDFADGTLYKKTKQLNGEELDSPFLVKE